ncbi:hypothetical protein LTR13_009920 [Exophiala sideris]|nr:hypothetical protein LTR13_009920 [Exophiala sideris]
MSKPSPTADRASNTSSAYAGAQNPIYDTFGAGTDTSRPSTASVARTEAYGSHEGNAYGRPVADLGLAYGSRRPSAESTTQTPSRALGVHSILNPQAEPTEREPTEFRSIGQPQMSITTGPAERSPQIRKRTDPRSPPIEHAQPGSARAGRRVLTPRSPGVRAASLGARRNAMFHSTVQPLRQSRSPGGRTYTAEPGQYGSSEIPPLPSLAIATGSNLPNLMNNESSSQTSSRPIPGSPHRSLGSLQTHQADRSATAQPPYPRIEQQSPIYGYGHSQPPMQRSAVPRVLPAGLQGSYGHETQMHGPHEGYQAGQAPYQVQVNTEVPMVIPLDDQSASRLADEKRKRNAGASARFRARRKEKEKEASQTISGLQQELRDLIEDRDYYLGERNYYRDLAARHVPPAQLLQRPPSPHHRRPERPAMPVTAPTSTSGGSPEPFISEDPYRDYSEAGSSAQRRRTGDFQPSFTGTHTQSPSQPAYSTGFISQPPAPLHPLPPPAMTNAYAAPLRSLPHGPPPPSVTRSQSYDPFRRDPYDSNWHASR